MEDNFLEFDTLKIQVRKEQQDLIDNCYNSLGWSKVDEKENPLYADTNELKLVRPHSIENKDELQLLQVHIENLLNKLWWLEQTKNIKTILLASFGGILIFLSAFFGVSLIFNTTALGFDILGGVTIAFSFGLLATTIILGKKIYQKEKSAFNHKTADTLNSISELCSRSRSLKGGNNVTKNTKNCQE